VVNSIIRAEGLVTAEPQTILNNGHSADRSLLSRGRVLCFSAVQSSACELTRRALKDMRGPSISTKRGEAPLPTHRVSDFILYSCRRYFTIYLHAIEPFVPICYSNYGTRGTKPRTQIPFAKYCSTTSKGNYKKKKEATTQPCCPPVLWHVSDDISHLELSQPCSSWVPQKVLGPMGKLLRLKHRYCLLCALNFIRELEGDRLHSQCTEMWRPWPRSTQTSVRPSQRDLCETLSWTCCSAFLLVYEQVTMSNAGWPVRIHQRIIKRNVNPPKRAAESWPHLPADKRRAGPSEAVKCPRSAERWCVPWCCGPEGAAAWADLSQSPQKASTPAYRRLEAGAPGTAEEAAQTPAVRTSHESTTLFPPLESRHTGEPVSHRMYFNLNPWRF